ncbi:MULTISPECIES: hypothetical protein [Pseudomonas]|uniref:hypothetical protein n=1 Tax=Pseudomonas TaxID=286 RepID=UPI001BE9E5D5|nr:MULTISPECIES: hypothetical protein [Pseudomonas]MBT2339266.1 hypothetical protein [Pseudomonas fluorescens]MCD4528937.1 hypothetical protein [Pseudomonas sp. C3-2018]
MSDHCSVFINAGAVVLLPMNMPAQDRLDVLNSVLFAQLVANKKCSELSRAGEWYGAYREVLKNGWLQKTMKWDHFSLNAPSTDNLMGWVQKRLGASVEPTRVAQLTRVLKRLAELSGTQPAIELLREQVLHPKEPEPLEAGLETTDIVRLQVLLGQPGPVLSSAYLEFEARHVTANPLGLLFSTDHALGNIQLRCFQADLSQALYAPFRDAIVKKLGDKAARHIVDISDAVAHEQPEGRTL